MQTQTPLTNHTTAHHTYTCSIHCITHKRHQTCRTTQHKHHTKHNTHSHTQHTHNKQLHRTQNHTQYSKLTSQSIQNRENKTCNSKQATTCRTDINPQNTMHDTHIPNHKHNTHNLTHSVHTHTAITTYK